VKSGLHGDAIVSLFRGKPRLLPVRPAKWRDAVERLEWIVGLGCVYCVYVLGTRIYIGSARVDADNPGQTASRALGIVSAVGGIHGLDYHRVSESRFDRDILLSQQCDACTEWQDTCVYCRAMHDFCWKRQYGWLMCTL
jgi:hypothetical protein